MYLRLTQTYLLKLSHHDLLLWANLVFCVIKILTMVEEVARRLACHAILYCPDIGPNLHQSTDPLFVNISNPGLWGRSLLKLLACSARPWRDYFVSPLTYRKGRTYTMHSNSMELIWDFKRTCDCDLLYQRPRELS